MLRDDPPLLVSSCLSKLSRCPETIGKVCALAGATGGSETAGSVKAFCFAWALSDLRWTSSTSFVVTSSRMLTFSGSFLESWEVRTQGNELVIGARAVSPKPLACKCCTECGELHALSSELAIDSRAASLRRQARWPSTAKGNKLETGLGGFPRRIGSLKTLHSLISDRGVSGGRLFLVGEVFLLSSSLSLVRLIMESNASLRSSNSSVSSSEAQVPTDRRCEYELLLGLDSLPVLALVCSLERREEGGERERARLSGGGL